MMDRDFRDRADGFEAQNLVIYFKKCYNLFITFFLIVH